VGYLGIETAPLSTNICLKNYHNASEVGNRVVDEILELKEIK